MIAEFPAPQLSQPTQSSRAAYRRHRENAKTGQPERANSRHLEFSPIPNLLRWAVLAISRRQIVAITDSSFASIWSRALEDEISQMSLFAPSSRIRELAKARGPEIGVPRGRVCGISRIRDNRQSRDRERRLARTREVPKPRTREFRVVVAGIGSVCAFSRCPDVAYAGYREVPCAGEQFLKGETC